jgi:hypothetical protein
MGVSFSAVDATRPRETPFGTFPGRVDLGERFEFFSWANENARVMFDLLGIDAGEELVGEATIAELRRAVMRARATVDRRAPELSRPGSVEYGAPVERDGVVEMRPVRIVRGPILEERIRERLEDLAAFVEAAARAGATGVTWG